MKNRYFVYALLVALLSAVGLRTWQLAVAVDEAGFYLSQYAGICAVLGYLLLGTAVILLGIGRFVLKNHPAVTPPKKSLPLGFAAAALAFSCIPQAVRDYNTATNLNTQVLSLISAVVLLFSFTAISAFALQGRKIPFGITVAPVFSELLRLIVNYSHFNGIARISENVIYVLFLCAFTGFCATHCRVFSGIGSKKALSLTYGTGACTVLFGALTCVPHWLAGQGEYVLSTLGLGAAIYAFVFLWVMAHQTPAPAEPTPVETAVPEQ